MERSSFLRHLAAAPVATALPAPVATSVPAPPPDPAVDRYFARAKVVWRMRVDPPYVRYRLTESYYWHDRRLSHAWIATLRTRDRRLVLARVPDPPNAPRDAFVVQDPPIVANDAFGFVDARRAGQVAVTAGGPAVAGPPATPAPQLRPQSAGGAPEPLREIARTEAFVRDYAIESAGVEPLFGASVEHFLLAPRRDANVNRLRDIWIDVLDGHVAQLSIQGLFTAPPYEASRWLVQYATIGGVPYVRRVFTVDDLDFAGQIVSFLSFDCDDYDFPASVPDGTFLQAGT